jgi:RNA polymerase sigma-70 factor, ECF subfamily
MDLRRFETLYAEHAQRIYGFLAYRTGDAGSAEDLLSDVFERALRRRRLFDRRRGTEEAWLYAIALNLVRDRHRRARTEQQGLERLGRERAEDVPDHGHAVGEREEVMRAVGSLTAEEREVVSLRFGADLTAPQIAKVLDMPLTTVEGRLYRALKRLRERLGEAATRPPR